MGSRELADGLDIFPLDAIGAEIFGIDVDRLTAVGVAALNAAWLRHGVLLFRNVDGGAAAHVRLSRVFGPLQEHVIPTLRLKENPELIALGGDGEQKGSAFVVDGAIRAGFLFLHQDGAYSDHISVGGVLRMVRAPEDGGDTMWVDTEKAYAALPSELKAACERHSTVQIWRDVPDRLWGWPHMQVRLARPDEGPVHPLPHQPFRPVLQPMVVTHPISGRRALLMSPLGYAGVWGMTRDEGDALYEAVALHCARPEFSYRHHWAEGDMVLWDNRRTMHAAFGYPYAQERVVQRTTLAGGMPTGRWLSEAEAAPYLA